MVQLRQALGQLHEEVRNHDNSPQQPAVCQSIVNHLPTLRQEMGVPVVSKRKFEDFMQSRVGLQVGVLTAESTAAWKALIDKALKFLSGFATVLSFSLPLAQDYVVIEPQWLLSDIVGRLMSEPPLPDPFVRYDNGFAEKEEVIKALGTKNLPGEAAF